MSKKYNQIASSNWQSKGRRKAWNDYRLKKTLIAFAIVGLLAILVVGIVSFIYHNKESVTLWSSTGEVNAESSAGAGKTITVRAGQDLQAALNQAVAGDTILLEAGATFKGAFKLPKKTGNAFITIRTSATDAQLPAANKRLDPVKYAPVLPKLVNPNGGSVVESTASAHHFRFIGIEFGATKGGENNMVQLGTGQEKSVEELAHHIEFDRCFFKGSPTEGQRRGIAANGRNIRVINSYFKDIKRKGDESQGIAAWAGDGPFEFANNYIEAGGENILIGGAGSNLKLIPSDIIVRDNYFNKPLEWRTQGWLVKNLFELKNAKRVKIERNLMTNNWTNGQNGTAILFTVRADNTNATIEDVEFTDNIVRGSGNAINILGSEGAGGKRVIIRNNLFDDIDGKKWDSGGIFLIATEWDGLTIENNTIINSGNISTAYGKPIKNFIFRSNIIAHNEYGFTGEGNVGKNTLAAHFPNSDITYNAVVGANAGIFNGKNSYPANWNTVGFIDFNKGNYRLGPKSNLQTAGFGGKSVGANLETVIIGGN